MSPFAMIFPGQGAQSVGMLSELAASFTQVKHTFEEASDALQYDMWNLIQNGEQRDLNLTEKTQPVLLTASVAIWRVWQSQTQARPVAMAGHSLGEYSALVCAESIRFADAVKLVQQRGRFMQRAVPVGEGAMAAVIGMQDDAVEQACQRAQQTTRKVVEAVNYNAPGQLVIAGNVAAVEQAEKNCKEAGARMVKRLQVSAPFHTSLMLPAAEKLKQSMASLEFAAPTIPVVHNLHAEIETDITNLKDLLFQQTFSPVRWVSCIQRLHHLDTSNSVGHMVECGPGKVLVGLNRRINKGLKNSSTEAPKLLAAAIENIEQR